MEVAARGLAGFGQVEEEVDEEAEQARDEDGVDGELVGREEEGVVGRVLGSQEGVVWRESEDEAEE